MQVMPEEQKGLGIKDPFDAEQNIMGAAKLLKAHLKKFNGDYTLAAAAYNAGSGAVKKYGGYDDIWCLFEIFRNGEHRRWLMRHSLIQVKKEDFAWQSDRGYHFSTASFRIL